MLIYPSFVLVSTAVNKPFFNSYRAGEVPRKFCSRCWWAEKEMFEWGRAPPFSAIGVNPSVLTRRSNGG